MNRIQLVRRVSEANEIVGELRRKYIETLAYEDLKRFVKLDNRVRIKENNSVRAKY